MARIPYKNRVELCGNVGNEPTIRYMPNGDAVLSLRLATQESWKDAKDQWQTHTEWHTVVMYRKLAERAEGYKKGDCIHVDGRKFTRQWTDDKNVKRTSVEIIAEDHHRVALDREDREQSAPLPTDAGEESDVPQTSMDGPEAIKRLG